MFLIKPLLSIVRITPRQQTSPLVYMCVQALTYRFAHTTVISSSVSRERLETVSLSQRSGSLGALLHDVCLAPREHRGGMHLVALLYNIGVSYRLVTMAFSDPLVLSLLLVILLQSYLILLFVIKSPLRYIGTKSYSSRETELN